ncbi:MAG: hypothetical protein WCG45_06170, partial [bacterium]
RKFCKYPFGTSRQIKENLKKFNRKFYLICPKCGEVVFPFKSNLKKISIKKISIKKIKIE